MTPETIDSEYEGWRWKRHDAQLFQKMEYDWVKDEQQQGNQPTEQEAQEGFFLYQVASTIINWWKTSR